MTAAFWNAQPEEAEQITTDRQNQRQSSLIEQNVIRRKRILGIVAEPWTSLQSLQHLLQPTDLVAAAGEVEFEKDIKDRVTQTFVDVFTEY